MHIRHCKIQVPMRNLLNRQVETIKRIRFENSFISLRHIVSLLSPFVTSMREVFCLQLCENDVQTVITAIHHLVLFDIGAL